MDDAIIILIILLPLTTLGLSVPFIVFRVLNNNAQKEFNGLLSLWEGFSGYEGSFSPTSKIQFNRMTYLSKRMQALPQAVIAVDSVQKRIAITFLENNQPIKKLHTDYLNFENIIGGGIVQMSNQTQFDSFGIGIGFGAAISTGTATQLAGHTFYQIKLNSVDSPIYWIVLSKKLIPNNTLEYSQFLQSASQLDALIQKITTEK